MTTPEQCEEILVRILDLVNANPLRRVSFSADWGGHSLTVHVDDAHSHVGQPDATWERLVDRLHGLLVRDEGLGFCGPGEMSSETLTQRLRVVKDEP